VNIPFGSMGDVKRGRSTDATEERRLVLAVSIGRARTERGLWVDRLLSRCLAARTSQPQPQPQSDPIQFELI